MHSSTFAWVLSFGHLSSFASASPFPLGSTSSASSLAVGIPLNCPSTGPYTAACWESLNVPQYYLKWTATNGPRCNSHGLGEDAAACFIALTTGQSFSCNITGAPSDEPKICPLASFDLGRYTPEEAYVLRAIYGLWKWFQSISTAFETTDLVPGVQLIAAQFDRPQHPFSVRFLELWMVLATGLLATPLAGSNQTIVTAYMEKARVDPQFGRVDEAVIVFEVTPLVAPYLEESFDWDPVDPFNRTAIQQYRGILDSGLSSVQAAITPWLALTANGTFAIDHVNPAANTRELFKPFYVWILSLWSQRRIEGDGIMATVSRNTDARAFHKYGHDSRFPISCDYYEANNICSAWWHHDATNATYSITNLFKRKSSKNYYQAMKGIFGSNLFGGEDLFLNRDICGDFSRQFMVRDGKTINCLIYSRLQFAEFSSTCEDSGCEFGGDPDSQVDWVDDHCFPASYLGDLRSKEGTKYVPCSYRDS